MAQIVRLEDSEVYNQAMEIGEAVWNIVLKWDYMAKKTVGEQFIRASDSIAANISESYGRYFFKEKKQFCYYSRGSLYETKTWLVKGKNRNLVSENEYQKLYEKLAQVHQKLNSYIKQLGKEK